MFLTHLTLSCPGRIHVILCLLPHVTRQPLCLGLPLRSQGTGSRVLSWSRAGTGCQCHINHRHLILIQYLKNLVNKIGWKTRTCFKFSKVINLIFGLLRWSAYRASEVASPQSTKNKISSTGVVSCTQDLIKNFSDKRLAATNTHIFIVS